MGITWGNFKKLKETPEKSLNLHKVPECYFNGSTYKTLISRSIWI